MVRLRNAVEDQQAFAVPNEVSNSRIAPQRLDVIEISYGMATHPQTCRLE